MITALRDELEKCQIGEKDRIQQAMARMNEENKQLKSIITALRDELDKCEIGRQNYL
jgi:hypothetical protein